MKIVQKDIPFYFELGVLNSNGKLQTGLVVTYAINKCSDDSLLTSGTASEVGTTGVYSFAYTFTTLADYRLQWITPVGYEDGLENITVGTAEITPADFWAYANRTLTSGGGGITAADVWNYLTTNPIVPDSILELILTNLDAKVSSITGTTPAQIWDHLGNLISKNGSIGLSLKTFLSSQGKKSFILPVDKNYKG